jgi:hypothetical protein
MNNNEKQQLRIRRKALTSFSVMVVDIIIQLVVICFKVDRATSSVINFLIFWPLYLFALCQSILVAEYYTRYFRSLSIKYLLLTIPVFLFLIYFIIKVVSN